MLAITVNYRLRQKMPQPPEALLTIGEIAARARHLAADPYAFTERCRHWARLGLLQAVERVGEGSGRHTLFPESEAYMAAVIAALAETGLQPAASRPVADAQSVARHALARWRGRPQPMLLEINFYPGGGSDIDVVRGSARQKPLKARGVDPNRRAIATITLNLGGLFAGVEGAS